MQGSLVPAMRPSSLPRWTLPVLYFLSAIHRQMFFSTFFTFISSERIEHVSLQMQRSLPWGPQQQIEWLDLFLTGI